VSDIKVISEWARDGDHSALFEFFEDEPFSRVVNIDYTTKRTHNKREKGI
jgi:hypothetical protein